MFRRFLAVVGVALAASAAASPSVAAASVSTVTTSATFTGATEEDGPDDTRISYCGGAGQAACTTNEPVQVRWGSGGPTQSRLGFQPLGSAALGQQVSLGRLTHHNTTINITAGITSVLLRLTTQVTDGGRSISFSEVLPLELGVNEIIDAQRPCPYGPAGGPCSDAVLLLKAGQVFTHEAGNVVYQLTIAGFGSPGGQLTSIMVTGEGGTTTRDLVGLVTKTPRLVADAGPDQTVDEGSTVGLDGSASRVEGLTYHWEQTGGPAVVLDDATAVRPTFPVGMFTEDQLLEFRLTVRDALEPDITSSDTVRITVRDVNDPPTAVAGGPYTVLEGGSVVLGGLATDPDDNITAVGWDFDGDGEFDDATGETPTFSAEGRDGPSVVPVSFRVCDAMDVCATDDTRVDVVNVAPTVDVGGDVTVYRNEAVSTLGGFIDPARALDDPYVFGWTDGATGTASYGSTLPHGVTYSQEGVYTVGLEVTDKDGGTGRDSRRITVLNRAPSCQQAVPTEPTLWPPNHRAVPVGITGLTDAEGDALAVTITGIRQDEPVRDPGSGHTGPDASGVGTDTAQLLPERSGRGDGRVYHVSFSVNDGHGGACSGTVAVGVPHDQRGAGPVDQGALYDSTIA
jgi:hypothetical protein